LEFGLQAAKRQEKTRLKAELQTRGLIQKDRFDFEKSH